jgi:hypothetical protein
MNFNRSKWLSGTELLLHQRVNSLWAPLFLLLKFKKSKAGRIFIKWIQPRDTGHVRPQVHQPAKKTEQKNTEKVGSQISSSGSIARLRDCECLCFALFAFFVNSCFVSL